MLILMLVALQPNTSARADSAPVGSFSFKPDPVSGVLLVRCKINSKLEITMALDTGGFMAVSQRVVDELGLPLTPALDQDGKPMRLVFPKTDRPMAVHPDSIQADDCLPWVSGQVIVLDTKTLRSLGSERVDGIVGMNAFGACSALFDFSNRRVTLWYPSTLSSEDLKKAGMEGAVQVPVEAPEMYFHTVVDLGNGKKARILLDTGAVQTGISHAMARELGLTPTRWVTRNSLMGPVRVAIAKIDKLTIGPFHLEDVTVEFPEKDSLSIPPHLGQDVLSQFLLLMDVPNKKLYLKPARKSANVENEPRPVWTSSVLGSSGVSAESRPSVRGCVR
jgi:hypothetical protein